MMRIAVILAALFCAPLVAADGTTNAPGHENDVTLTGRVQSLSMYRDYDAAGNGANSTVGVVLGYQATAVRGFAAGFAYNYAGAVFENKNAGMLANDDIHVLNEAWIRFDLGVFNLSKTTVLLGRKIVDGEVFRADDFRQKARSIEGIQLEINEIPNTRLSIGHALRMSSWIQSGDKWGFRDFGGNTKGVTWGESVYGGFHDIEIAVFDAYSWDVANLVGARLRWGGADRPALAACYRHEGDVGRGAAHTADAFGVSAPMEIGGVAVEPGLFTVRGDDLLFQETTTGINHPLGSSMMILAKQFSGAADTAYLKAVAKVAGSTVYLLYNYTRQRNADINGQELNFVLKYPLTDRFTAALKSGIGKLDFTDSADISASDTRLFLTYRF